MRSRLRVLSTFLVVLAAGTFLGSALAQWMAPAPAPSRTPLDPAPPGGRVRVEVLNAGGRSGMARRATRLLRDAGFDVVYFGNAEAFDEGTSTVLDRVGEPAVAAAVAAVLEVEAVRTEIEPDLLVDVTVRLGRGWEPPEVREEEPEDTTRWWDLRRFLPQSGPGEGSPG